MALPEPVAPFAAHFTAAVYDDEGDEHAPFGHDEGWDLVMEWGERRDELGPESGLSTVLGTDDVRNVAGPMEGVDGLETAMFLQGAAFTLLRLTGRIDDADRALALEALAHLLGVVGDEATLTTQRDDLRSWRNPA